MSEPLNCPVCQSNKVLLWSMAKDYEYFSTYKTYTYFKCNDCNTIFIDPVPVNDLKIIYPKNYYSFTDSKKNWAFRIKEWFDKKIFTNLLRDIRTERINILDIGGGTGWLLDAIKKIDPRIHVTQVVDIDSSAKEIAEANGHSYFEGKIEEFKPVVQFQLILMLNIIEHVDNPENVLRHIYEYLSDDGIVLIKTPNTISLDGFLFKKTYWGGLHCPRHWIIFSEKSFKLLINKTKFSLKSVKYTQAGAFWAFSIIIFLSGRNLLKTSKERPVIFHPLFPLISSFFAVVDFTLSLFTRTSQMFIILKKRH